VSGPRRWPLGKRALLLLLPFCLLLLGVWALNASRIGARVEGCPERCAWTPQPPTTSRPPGRLRVVSLNILHGFPLFRYLDERLDLIAAEIRRLDADIVFLQEVPWHWGSAARELAEQTGLYFLYVRATGNRWTLLFEEGEAILSRYPLRDAAFVELQPRAGYFQHRVALQATVSTAGGDLRLVSTHLSHDNREANRGQAEMLAALLGPASSGTGPTLVGGDFNAVETSAQIQNLVSAGGGMGWIDVYRQVHPDEPGYTCCVPDLTSAPGQPMRRRIDYLFAIPGDQPLRVASSQVVFDHPARLANGWLWASDHAGLFAELEWQP
jgi:endonuclease/exonuclease/phosphatase family metal-dependent hydrolase